MPAAVRTTRTKRFAPTTLAFAAGATLCAGAALAWMVGMPLWPAVAVIAMIEIVVLLTRIGHLQAPTIPAADTAPVAPNDSTMTRTRRIASSMRDLRSAASGLPDAVVLLDTEQHVRWFNHAAEDLLGLRRPQDRGSVLADRLRQSDLAGWLDSGAHERLDDLAAPGHPNKQLSVTLLPFGKRQRLLLARDISDLTRLEQVRRDFVANVSHELRTPLTVIHGYLELLDPEDVPELAPVLNEMRAQSKRMGQIVEDLLTLSRLETQEHVADERVGMSALLATVRKEAQALSQGRHTITLESTAERDLLGSPRDLHSALSNLVSNAVRYTPSGGSITISWQRIGEGAAYAVSDTGYGIAPGHVARLTERFYRVSSSRSRDSGGTGLGLSIVKHVLNLHQARMQIQSTPGQGSTFTCHFGAERLLLMNGSGEA